MNGSLAVKRWSVKPILIKDRKFESYPFNKINKQLINKIILLK